MNIQQCAMLKMIIKRRKKLHIHDIDMTNTLTQTFYLLAREKKNVFLPRIISYDIDFKTLTTIFYYSQSFAQKLTGLVAGPQDGPQDDTPWYLRYGARGLGIVAAFCK